MPATVEIKNGPYSPILWTDMIHTQANGNAVIEMGTVGDVTVDFDKYVIQVFDATVSSIDPVNDIRIAPNRVGRAVINIRNLLQTQIERYKATGNNLFGRDTPNTWERGAEWTSEWFLKVGSETGGTLTINATSQLASVVMARNEERKLENLLEYAWIPRAAGSGIEPGCTNVTNVAKILTDWTYSKVAAQITDGKPSFLQSTQPILMQHHRENDFRTLSILNRVEREDRGAGLPNANVTQCEGAWLYSYDSSGTQLSLQFFPNTTAQGGGPNFGIFDGFDVEYPNVYQSFNINWPGQLPANTSHYYVIFSMGTIQACESETQANVMPQPGWMPVRYDIRPQKCNDYDNINVRWMNSFGFWDYFTFTKKNEKRYNAERNEFTNNLFSYNDTFTGSDARWRGRTVYSQKLTEEFTITTDFLEDHEMKYLENMFFSPDVQYIDGEGNQYAATIKNKSIVEKTYRKNKLFQLEITLVNAINLNSQRG